MTMEAPLVRWRAAHTRPRCEKKIADQCVLEGLEYSLPLYRSVKKYRGKTVQFSKPLFPGYLFFRSDKAKADKIAQQDQVARILVPADDAEFIAQLEDILRALSTEREIRLAPQIVDGIRVRILRGPLRGMEGFVVRRSGLLEVYLRLDFIGQCAAVRVTADELEPV